MGERQSIPNRRKECFSLVDVCGGVPIGPQDSGKIGVPLASKTGCVLPKHRLERSVETLYCSITLRVMGSSIEFSGLQHPT